MAGMVFMDQSDQLQPVGVENHLHKSKDIDDRFKKGEWTDGAINALLDAYESKWNTRNRGNLRVGDWDEVAKHVSLRTHSLKSASQCKNKMESMKKKYRSEAIDSCNSRTGWPFFSRMDSLLRCPSRMAGIPGGLDAGGQPVLGFQDAVPQIELGDVEEAGFINLKKEVPFSHLQLLQGNQDLQGQAFFPEEEEEEEEEDGIQEVESSGEDGSNTIPNRKERASPDSGTSVPGNKIVQVAEANLKQTAKQRRKKIHDEVLASIKTFADSFLKLEQAKMEMYKDTERLRAQAEAKRAELELKRTEMIMNTQLQIAKMFSENIHKRKKADGAPPPTMRKKIAEAGTFAAQYTNEHMQISAQAKTATLQESPDKEGNR